MAKARLYFDGDNTYIEKQARIYKMVDEIGDKIDNIPGVINDLNSTSETDALSAAMGKELQDQINALSGNFHFLSSWDCTTGLPGSDPATDPYTYQSGDYYIVSNTGSTNYKPHGSSYTHGVASTAVETQPVQMNDWYVYDGSTWILQPSGGAQIVVDTALSTTSTNPVENRVITQALNNKQDTIPNLNNVISGAAAGATALQPGDNITQLTNNAGYQTAGDVASAISGKQDTLTAGEGIAINNNVITNTGITCLEGGTDIEVVPGGMLHNLPTGYTELEYVTATGDQLITLNLTGDAVVDFKAQGVTPMSASNVLFDSSQNGGVGYYYGGLTTDNGIWAYTTIPFYTDVTGHLSYVGNAVEGTVGSASVSRSRETTITRGTWTLFGTMSQTLGYQFPFYGRLYYFKATQNGTVTYNLIPAKNSSNVAGLYDIVNNVFYTSSRTALTAGPEATEGCTTVNFTNDSGYVTINDVNVKVFNLSSISDLTTAQAAYDFGASGGVPIIRYSGETFIPHTATFTGGNAPFWAPTTYGNGSSYTTVDAKQLYVYASNGTVTQVSRYGYTSNTLSTGKNYTTPYTPEYDGSPATKKYVDSKLYVGTTAPSNPTAGQLWYDTTNSKLKVYNGSAWEEVGSGGGGGSTTWGNIGGILSNQTDLANALDEKLESGDLIAGDGINIQAVGSELPSGYTQLAYIELNGTQALNTGITGIGKTIEVDTQCTNSSSSSRQIVSSYGEDYLGMFFGAIGGSWAIQNNTAGKIAGVDVSSRNIITGKFSLPNNQNKIELTVSGNTVSYTRTNAARPDDNICLGGAISTTNTLLYPYSGYIFSARIYDTTTNVDVAKYIPCQNISSIPGLYDTVSGTFFPATKGTFIAGPAVQAEGIEISVDDSVFTTDSVTGGTDIEIVTQTGRGLPTGYTEIEYLQSSGTQWIDTGVVGNVSSTRTLKSDVGVRYDTVPAADTCLLGSRSGNVRAYMVYSYMGWCLGYGGQYRWAGNITAETKYFVTTEYKENSQTFDVNGLRAMSYTDNMPFTTDLNMYLFAINEGGVAKRFQSAKVYYAKIYVNDVLEFDGVPAKRNSDNALGIYDMVTGTFFTNQGSGTFTAGPVVQPGTVINFTNDSGYVTAADIPTYTAGTGIDITSNVISSTVLGFNNLTYDSFTSGTWTANATVTFPTTAKMAFLNWRAKSTATGTPPFACGQVLLVRGLTLVSSFVGGGNGTDYIYGGVGLDSASTYIDYTQASKTSGAAGIDYTIYFFK